MANLTPAQQADFQVQVRAALDHFDPVAIVDWQQGTVRGSIPPNPTVNLDNLAMAWQNAAGQTEQAAVLSRYLSLLSKVPTADPQTLSQTLSMALYPDNYLRETNGMVARPFMASLSQVLVQPRGEGQITLIAEDLSAAGLTEDEAFNIAHDRLKTVPFDFYTLDAPVQVYEIASTVPSVPACLAAIGLTSLLDSFKAEEWIVAIPAPDTLMALVLPRDPSEAASAVQQLIGVSLQIAESDPHPLTNDIIYVRPAGADPRLETTTITVIDSVPQVQLGLHLTSRLGL